MDDFLAVLKSVLRGWRTRTIPQNALSSMYLFQSYSEHYPMASPQEVTLAVLKRGLEKLALSSPESSTLLRERFELQMTMAELCLQYACSESKLYELQREAIGLLHDTFIALENENQSPRNVSTLRHLPLQGHRRLFGLATHLNKVAPLISQDTPPWITAIVGIGGIGKTSFADALARQLIAEEEFEEVAWISAQQVVFSLTGEIQSTGRTALTPESLLESLLSQTTTLSQVRTTTSVDEAIRTLISRFQTKRYLIVIDNFETISDIERLLPILRQLVQPSKVLLTARVYPLQTDDLFAYALPELSRTDALDLLKTEAHLHNFEDLVRQPDLLESIYATVGGNPLALRLIVGQAFLFGLAKVLNDMYEARHSGERLYRYIYQYIWTNLSEPVRALLLAMPLVPESGGPLDLLTHVVELPEEEVRTYLSQLIAQNLVNVQGTAQTRLYSIHNLTRAFLKEAIINWH